MGMIAVNGTRLHYRNEGTGEPLVFVHGLGSSGHDWAKQVDAFSDRYRVITFDVRGHGQSDKPEGPYSIPLFAADAAALLRTLEAVPATIVGLSMGGMIALQLAVDAPDLVRRLVVVNSMPEAKLDSLRDRWIYWSRRLVSSWIGMRATGEFIASRIFPKPEQGTLRQQFIERWAANDKQAYLATIDAIAGWSVEEQLDQITCPTLVVAAADDYTPVSVKRNYIDRMPNASLEVIEDAHHATPVERPQTFNRIVEQFLETS
jgi:pimeloyl-ACP methyl ester carboxylesterase